MLSESEVERIENTVWATYLNTASNIEIHKSVIDSNWDSNVFLLKWLLQHAHVDKATILIAYWMSAPRWYKQYCNREECKPFEREQYDLVVEFEQKYTSGFYEFSQIELDPSNDQDDWDWTNDYAEIALSQEIPSQMFQKLSGAKIDRPTEGYESGLPIDIYEKMLTLFESDK